MKTIIRQLLGLAVAIVAGTGIASAQTEWELVWQDEFNDSIDTAVWSKIKRGKPDWSNTMSSDDRLFEVRDGILILRGMVNDDPTDPSPYITGGIETAHKHAFEPGGRLVVKARLHGAKGAWPAIWLMPFDRRQEWPQEGEIDILERLNNNHYAYQTVHSHYTQNLGHTKEPIRNGGLNPIDRDGWNTYGVEWDGDAVQFYINGRPTHRYPRIETDEPGQFPFNHDWYLMLDMQLGGHWVGEVDPDDLPVEMEIDWVRYYRPKTDSGN